MTSRFRTTNALALLVVFVVAGPLACGDDSDTTTEDDEAELVVEPDTLTFSAELEAGETDENAVTISNAGTGDLKVSELEFSGNTHEAFEAGDGWFDEPLELGKDESHELSVIFEMPEQGTTFEGSLSFQTNDPDQSEAEVELVVSGSDESPELYVAPYIVAFPPGSDAGEAVEESVVIENRGADTLQVWDVEFGTNPDDVFQKGDHWPDGELELDADESHDFTIIFEREDMTTDYEGTLELHSNDPDADSPTEIQLQSGPAPSPEIYIDPDAVTFPHTSPGDTSEDVVTIQNIGHAPLDIDDITISEGSSDYSISFFEQWDEMGDLPDPDDDLDAPPESIEPGEQLYLRVVFAPGDDDASYGEIVVESNDPYQKTQHISLVGNSGTPCLQVVGGQELHFGPGAIDASNERTLVLHNCSVDAPTVVTDLGISDDGGGVFSLSEDHLSVDFSTDTLELAPGEVEIIVLRYMPDDATTHAGELHIDSNDAAIPVMSVPLDGEGIDADCPVAEAAGSVDGQPPENPVTADALQTVELTSEGSYDPDGGPLDYEWSILRYPEGSLAMIDSPQEAEPSLDIDIAGHFLVELSVDNDDGLANCEVEFLEIHP